MFGMVLNTLPFRRSNRLSYQAMRSTRTQSQLCRATPISSYCSVFTFRLAIAFVSRHICFNQVSSGMNRYYGIHHLRILYICNHKNNVPSWLSPHWLCGNSCTWAHNHMMYGCIYDDDIMITYMITYIYIIFYTEEFNLIVTLMACKNYF